MAHGHTHSHSATLGQAFLIGIVLNLTYVIVEFGFGYFANSMALMADAGHNLQDVLTLGLSGWALSLAKKPATLDLTYGYKKVTILSALAGGLVLAVTCGMIFFEAVQRLSVPESVEAKTIIWVSLLGVAINAGTAFFFFRHKDELNARGALLHLIGDAAISLGVMLVGIVMLYYPVRWLDPVVSILVAVIILVSSWKLLKDSFYLAIDAVPSGIDVNLIEAAILKTGHVKGIHHIHVWPLSTMEHALTAHLEVESLSDNRIINEVSGILEHDFGIRHSTLQLELISSSKAEAGCVQEDES